MTGIETIAVATAWWEAKMTTDLRSVTIKAGGYVRFAWKNSSNAGSYHIQIEQLECFDKQRKASAL